MSKEVKYVRSMLFQELPYQLYSLDTQKVLVLYMLVGTSKVTQIDLPREQIEDYLKNVSVRNKEGEIIGFRCSTSFPDDDPHVVHSYCAIAISKMLDLKICNSISKKEALDWIISLINEDGSIRGSYLNEECDLRMIYSACAYLDLLEIDLKPVKESILSFVLQCQNQDGGFGLKPHLETHGGATYCGVSILKMLGENIPYQTRLIQWLVGRQILIGEDDFKREVMGFQGRINKVPDSCYSFWCGWTLGILDQFNLIEKEPLNNFLDQCHSFQGGYSREPGGRPDPVHTLHSLLGQNLEYDKKIDLVHVILF